MRASSTACTGNLLSCSSWSSPLLFLTKEDLDAKDDEPDTNVRRLLVVC